MRVKQITSVIVGLQMKRFCVMIFYNQIKLDLHFKLTKKENVTF